MGYTMNDSQRDKFLAQNKKLTEKVIADLKEGKFFAWDPQCVRAPLPHNIRGKKTYRGFNRVLLMFQQQINGWKDSRWLTARQLKEKGGTLLDEEKQRPTMVSYFIFDEPVKIHKDGKWIQVYEKDEDGNYILDDNGKKKPKIRHLNRPKEMISYVYNVCQTTLQIEPEQKDPNIDVTKRNEILEKIIENSEAKVYHDQLSRNYYSPSLDQIHVMPKSKFTSMDGYYATVTHEIVHSTGHESRNNRNLKNSFGSKDYAREELCAEMGSMFLSQEYGIEFDESHYKNHAAYLLNWIQVLEKNPDELYKASQQAMAAIQYIKKNILTRENVKADEKEEERSEFVKLCEGDINANPTWGDLSFFNEYIRENDPDIEELANVIEGEAVEVKENQSEKQEEHTPEVTEDGIRPEAVQPKEESVEDTKTDNVTDINTVKKPEPLPVIKAPTAAPASAAIAKLNDPARKNKIEEILKRAKEQKSQNSSTLTAAVR